MYKVYQVQINDTIDEIARKTGTTREEIISINALTGNVTPGQLIVVPKNDSIFDTYVVVKGDNTYEIARRYNIDLNTLLKINGLDQDDFIYPNQELLVPKSNIIIYVTKENDTLNRVADMMNVSTGELVNQNQELYLLPEQLIIKTN